MRRATAALKAAGIPYAVVGGNAVASWVARVTSFLDKDRTHIRDMIDVGPVDESWLARLPETLSGRLKELLDHPEG